MKVEEAATLENPTCRGYFNEFLQQARGWVRSYIRCFLIHTFDDYIMEEKIESDMSKPTNYIAVAVCVWQVISYTEWLLPPFMIRA